MDRENREDVLMEEKPIYMDGYLRSNLTIAKKMMKKDFDMVCVIDGMERAGKSVLAMQIAKFFDESFCLERVTFTGAEFRKQVRDADRFQAVVLDEGMTALFSRASMSKGNINIVRLLAEIGQKNLYIIIVLPSFFVLDMYAAIHRSRFLIHVYSKKLTRGFFQFYNMERKKNLYFMGKKFYDYRKGRPNFFGRFANQYAVDETEYRKKKADSLIGAQEDDKLWYVEVAKYGRHLQQRVNDIAKYISDNGKPINRRSISDWAPPVKKAK